MAGFRSATSMSASARSFAVSPAPAATSRSARVRVAMMARRRYSAFASALQGLGPQAQCSRYSLR